MILNFWITSHQQVFEASDDCHSFTGTHTRVFNIFLITRIRYASDVAARCITNIFRNYYVSIHRFGFNMLFSECTRVRPPAPAAALIMTTATTSIEYRYLNRQHRWLPAACSAPQPCPPPDGSLPGSLISDCREATLTPQAVQLPQVALKRCPRQTRRPSRCVALFPVVCPARLYPPHPAREQRPPHLPRNINHAIGNRYGHQPAEPKRLFLSCIGVATPGRECCLGTASAIVLARVRSLGRYSPICEWAAGDCGAQTATVGASARSLDRSLRWQDAGNMLAIQHMCFIVAAPNCAGAPLY